MSLLELPVRIRVAVLPISPAGFASAFDFMAEAIVLKEISCHTKACSGTNTRKIGALTPLIVALLIPSLLRL